MSFVAHGPLMIKLFNFMKFEYSECTGNLMHIVYYIHRKLFPFFQKGVEIDVLIENKKVTVKVTGLSEESVQEAVAMVSFLLKRILVCLVFWFFFYVIDEYYAVKFTRIFMHTAKLFRCITLYREKFVIHFRSKRRLQPKGKSK